MANHPETLPRPPRWAESLLRVCLPPADRDAVSGDLLEEYRDTVRPFRGRFGADGWYLRRVAGVLGRLLWPGLILLAVPVTGFVIAAIRGDAVGFFGWLPRALPAPGVSLLDAVIYAWTAYYAARRTRLVRTGLMAAAVCSFVNLALLFIAFDLKFGLLQTMFAKPSLTWVVILAAYQGLALGFSVVPGLIGASLGVVLSPWRRASL